MTPASRSRQKKVTNEFLAREKTNLGEVTSVCKHIGEMGRDHGTQREGSDGDLGFCRNLKKIKISEVKKKTLLGGAGPCYCGGLAELKGGLM